MRAFWADVLRPALNALAPESARDVARRIRNAAGVTAIVVLLLPHYGPLGTGTVRAANVLAGIYVAVTVVTHLRQARAHGDRIGAAALLAAGAFAYFRSRAWWGLMLAALAWVHVACSEARRRSVRLPPTPREPDARPKSHDGWPYRIERISYAFATAFVFWSLLFQHMKVPTGSMQPTIMGDHVVGGRPHMGDRLLADKTVYWLREPRRWEIVVFEYPLRRDILFVKRLIGLSGEHVEIRDGDIWIDGRVAAKPPLVQESLWRERFPRSTPTSKPRKIPGAWKVSEDAGWRRDGDAALRLVARGDREALARYSGTLAAGDVRMTFVVEAQSEGARVLATVESYGRKVRLVVPRDGTGTLTYADEPPVEFPARLSGATGVALAIVDGRARAWIDGTEVAELEMPSARRGRVRVAFGGAGGEMRFSAVRVDEDVVYKLDPNGQNTFDVPADGYVMLGDNSAKSIDSRGWKARRFHVRGMDEPLVAEDFSTDMRGGSRANIIRTRETIRFIDSEGVAREIATADVTGEDPPVAVPYVPRDHVVGRAALIFWPMPPAGAWRPRILP